MPAFEFSFILRVLPRHEMAAALKRVGTLLLEKGVIVTNLENLGSRDLPFKMAKETQLFSKGSYFAYSFMGERSIFPEIKEVCDRDLDIIRHGFMLAPTPLSQECTLEKEMLPAGERESVKQLMERSRRFRERMKPRSKHVVEHNWFDIYM